MTQHRPHRLFLLLLGMIALPGVQASEDMTVAQLFGDKPKVVKAMDLIYPVDEHVTLGTDLIFKPRATAAATKLLQGAARVRIFTLGTFDKYPQALPRDPKDDCDTFATTVHPILTSAAGGGVAFDKMDERWLDVTYGGMNIKDGRYLLVFESGGPASGQFRILSENKTQYFDAGLRIVVAMSAVANIERAKAEFEKRQKDLLQLLSVIDRKKDGVPCYGYGVAQHIEGLTVAHLARCEGREDEVLQQ